MFFFAHAGEDHSSAAESGLHAALGSWYIALPLFIVVLLGVGVAAYLLSRRSKSTALLAVLSVLFIVGLIGYRYSSVLSIVSLSAGFALALMLVIGGLGNSEK